MYTLIPLSHSTVIPCSVKMNMNIPMSLMKNSALGVKGDATGFLVITGRVPLNMWITVFVETKKNIENSQTLNLGLFERFR